LLDQDPPVRHRPGPSDPRLARRHYLSWLRRVSDHGARRQSIWRSTTVRTLGVMILLGILCGNLWLCWIAWSYDAEEAARGGAFEARAAQQGGARERSGWGR